MPDKAGLSLLHSVWRREVIGDHGGSSRRRKANCWAEIMANCQEDENMMTRKGEKERKEIWMKGMSCLASQVASQIAACFEKTQRDTENTRVKKKKSMVPVSFFWFVAFFPTWHRLCLLYSSVLLHTTPTPPPSAVYPPFSSVPSLSFLSPSPHTSSSLMTELLAGKVKAAFSHLIRSLNSPEKKSGSLKF